VVRFAVVGPKSEEYTYGLVDSGSEHTLIAPWMARATGVQPGSDAPELNVGLGGRSRLIRFTDARLRLPHPTDGDVAHEWVAQVGVITDQWEPPWALLGQVGFFDEFTVTMNRLAQGLAIDHRERWDALFPTSPIDAGEAEWTDPSYY